MRLDFLKDFDYFTGVPDSQLRALCDYLIFTYGTDPKHHIIAANEGNAVAIAAGYHLATGKVPVVYMQNSGEGNIINPVASLLNDKVYVIPCLFSIRATTLSFQQRVRRAANCLRSARRAAKVTDMIF